MTPKIEKIRLSQIVPGDNDRTQFDQAALQELADSIAKIGLAQPITLRPYKGKLSIVAGERRYRAVGLLKWETISAIVRPLTDEQADSVMLAENLNRADLDPIEEAQAIKKRIDRYKWTIAQAAKNTHISAGRVRSRPALLDLIPDIQKLVRFGNFPLGHAGLMKNLNKFYQLAAIRAYQSTPKPPTRKKFAIIVGNLEAKQNQADLFDRDSFMLKDIPKLKDIPQIVKSVELPKVYRLQATIGTVKIDLSIEVKPVSLPGFRPALFGLSRVFQGVG